MSETKHTIGPWEVTDQNGDPESSFRGVRRPTQINSLGKPYNMYVAQFCKPEDAVLIAAAPDMLAALKATRSLISEAAMTGFRWDEGDWAERLYANQATLSQAIKKAEGE